MDTHNTFDRSSETPAQVLERLCKEFPDAQNLTQLGTSIEARLMLIPDGVMKSYRLVDREPVQVSLLEHLLYMQVTAPHVADDYLDEGKLRVSTVFIGVGHVLFETAVFREGEVITMRRYRTWNAAAAGHAEVLAELKAQPPEDTDS